MLTHTENICLSLQTGSGSPTVNSVLLVESRCGAVALGRTYLLPPLSSGGALLVPPWLRFHIPLIEPDRQICRVAQPLLAFAPTEPTVRRYRSGLFRKDLRRVDHRRHAWWITGSGRGKAIRSRR